MLRKLFVTAALLAVMPWFAQTDVIQKSEITTLLNDADDALTRKDFRASLQYSREALKRSIAAADDRLIAQSYNVIAGNYYDLAEKDKSIKYYNLGLRFAQRAKNDSLLGWLHNNMGNIYSLDRSKIELSAQHYRTALRYYARYDDKKEALATKLNLATLYFNNQQFSAGTPYLRQVNIEKDLLDVSTYHALIAILNGMYEAHVRNSEKAIVFFDQAESIALAHGLTDDHMTALSQKAFFLASIGQHKGAFEALAAYEEMREKYQTEIRVKMGAAEGLNLEIDEYKRALTRIETEKELQSLSLKKSQIIVILFIVTLTVLLLLTYILLRNNNYRKKTNAELTQANEELQKAKEKAEEAALLKTQFVSTISHELRTPLYGVVGITEILSDEHKELANSPHLSSLKFSARYLLSLVNDILQINKIEEKRVVLENMPFNIADELQTIMESLQFIANTNHNTVLLDLDPRIPEILIADKLRLSQIFMNLVSNALKFTHHGTVHLVAKLEKTEGFIHYIRFDVVDSGIGIAPEDQQKIFEKFVQIERKGNDYQGTGLGLAIVQKLIELFGSEIYLESAEGKGSRFWFTIAFDSDPDHYTQIVNNIEVNLSRTQGYAILVVEDNKINQMVTRKILENSHFTTTIADDGIAALSILQKKSFDVILMDINMPIINGFETTRRLRAMGITTPVLALTAYDKGEVTEEALSAGMNDIIIKPFEPVKLFQIINAQIHKKNAGS